MITSGPVLQHAAELSDTRTSLQSLREHITVKVATNADVITIRVLAPTPRGAASLANQIGTAYNEVAAEQSRKETERVVRELDLIDLALLPAPANYRDDGLLAATLAAPGVVGPYPASQGAPGRRLRLDPPAGRSWPGGAWWARSQPAGEQRPSRSVAAG